MAGAPANAWCRSFPFSPSLTNTVGANVSFNVTARLCPLATNGSVRTNLVNGGNVSGATLSRWR
jgi:hypothetical protein